MQITVDRRFLVRFIERAQSPRVAIPMSASQVKVCPLTPAIGAELSGVDLNQRMPDHEFDAIYEALIEHQVIFFKNQLISPENYLNFFRSFGEPEEHPVEIRQMYRWRSDADNANHY